MVLLEVVRKIEEQELDFEKVKMKSFEISGNVLYLKDIKNECLTYEHIFLIGGKYIF